jgi:calcium/calmodulin-dependent protein kinase (CaM kinase) II
MSEEANQHLLELNQRLLNAIFAGDWKTYAGLCDEQVTCFEPEGLGHLIAGLPFHKFYFDLAESGGASGANCTPTQVTMATPVVKLLGDTALVLYTRLVQVLTANGPVTKRVEETRVWHKGTARGADAAWKLVHVHRSLPA